MVECRLTEDRLVRLGSQCGSCASVSTVLVPRGGHEWHYAFLGAVGRRSLVDQAPVRDHALGRADTVSERLQVGGNLSEEELEATLRISARLRQMILAP
jgi:hypothetical protein